MYRAGAIIVNEGKLLLVTDGDEKVYWSPGGRLEPGETPEEAVKRECKEELGTSVQKVIYYTSYSTLHVEETELKEFGYYFVDYEGEPVAQEFNTKLIWVSKEMFLSGSIQVTESLQTQLIPKLIAEHIIF